MPVYQAGALKDNLVAQSHLVCEAGVIFKAQKQYKKVYIPLSMYPGRFIDMLYNLSFYTN